MPLPDPLALFPSRRSHSGTDLEKYPLANMDQARSVLLQVGWRASGAHRSQGGLLHTVLSTPCAAGIESMCSPPYLHLRPTRP